MFNPLGKLAHNTCKAQQVYNQHCKKLHMSPQNKKDVIESKDKLQSLEDVGFMNNLIPAQKEILRTNSIQTLDLGEQFGMVIL